MASPRERQRTTRRRIAGERTRPSADGPAAAAPTGPAETAPPEQATLAEDAPDTQDVQDVPEVADAPAVRPDEETEGSGGTEASGPAAARPGRTFSLPWLGGDDAGPGPANWVLAVLAGLLVAALALDGFVVWREVSHRQAEEDAARSMHSAIVQAPSVADKAATALLGYRYDRLPQDLAEARKYLTADYAPAYVDTVRKLVAGSAEDLKVTVRADVLASGVSEAGPQRADVLLFVNQTTVSATERPKTALNRVVFTMVPRDGGWKVDEIQAF